MKWQTMEFVRIYLTENDQRVKPLLKRLHDDEQVQGVTVLRGISGFGRSGKMHTASLLDLSLDLPVVIEFFDTPQKINRVLDDLADLLEPGHIIKTPIEMNM